MARPRWRVPDVRLALVGVLLVFAWIGVGIRLIDIQAVRADQYAEQGLDQRIKHEELAAVRGTIFDRDGVELAVTMEAVTVFADPAVVREPEITSQLLAPIVGLSAEELIQRLTAKSRFVYIARRLEPEEAARVRDVVETESLKGIYFEKEFKRVYPADSLASQLIGFVRDDDQEGIEGLEYQYQEALKGESGSQIIERDPYRNPIPQGQFVVEPPVHGADIVLTIDREIQHAVETALVRSLEETQANSGTVVVLDVATGEILAMATAPSFNPNRRSTADPVTFRNRAIADMYEPGSTLKVVTVVAAIDQDVISEETLLLLPSKYVIPLEPDPKVYTDVGRRSEEEMNVAEIVARSSNIGTITIQEMIGNEIHYNYLSAFGLGRKATGNLPGEASGLLRPVEDWCASTCGPSTAIGYRVDATILQMASVFATIGNDGVWVQPYVVKEIVRADGSRERFHPLKRPVLSEVTAQTMQKLLRGVVESKRGTGHRAAVAEYTVGGKTGTTEKFLPELGRYSENARVASFIGIAPVSSPHIAVAVMLDNPKGENAEGADFRFGGVSAAPVFAEIVQAALHRIGVVPDVP